MKRSYSYSLMVQVLSLGLVAMLLCQDAAAEKTTFRDLTRQFFKDGNGQDLAKLIGYTTPVKKVIALEYKVLLYADGKETPVDPKTYQFKLGDRIRVAIEPLDDYYVYIYHIGASGSQSFLLPSADEDPPLAKRGQPIGLPGDGYIEFTEPAGDETLLVVATEQPVPDRKVLEKVLTAKPGEQDTPEMQAVRQTLKATRKKVLKSVAETRKELLDHTVMWRGIATEKAQSKLAEDVRTRGVKDGTFEEPTKEGISAMYVTVEEQSTPRLLVNIPLKSVAAEEKK